ncbi:hypothetical protein [Streptomyces sp. NPDC101132]|uniref:hypothetical protein n=1 Tax=Streptomyces sp. NPDC101132 TaxID=3366110 RepID=UPI00380A59A0
MPTLAVAAVTGLLACGLAALALHARRLNRQVGTLGAELDDLRTEIACARIEGVLAQPQTVPGARAGEGPVQHRAP